MIHIKVWEGSKTIRITDMTNAGKRGKSCRVLYISGVPWGQSSLETPDQRKARKWTEKVMGQIEEVAPGCRYNPQMVNLCFDAVAGKLEALLETARLDGIPENYVCGSLKEIKGIHAPKSFLTAGVPGKWSARADERGITVHALDDPNKWTVITCYSQSRARAYAIAAKVWDRVQQAETIHEVTEILRAAGAHLHGYCAMD